MKDGNKCVIYIVRHGESRANLENIVQGHFDSRLTERGAEQARLTAEELGGVNFDSIYSSDLSRSLETAEILKSGRDVRIYTNPLLRERAFGSFEGMDREEFMEKFREEFDRFDNELDADHKWEHKPHLSIESDKELFERFNSALTEIAEQNIGGTIFVVAHRNIIRAFLMGIGFIKYGDRHRGSLKNGGYVILESDGSSFSVQKVYNSEE